MAFLSGPRQVGKTTLSHDVEARFSQHLYFNWDVITDQKKILKNPYFFETENRNTSEPFLVVLDEIHKYSRWKNYLKGAFDQHKSQFRFLITGSGRLDLYKKGGDSLLGRYFSVPLFPLSVGEIKGHMPSLKTFKAALLNPPQANATTSEAYQTLFQFSGFPEPYLRATDRFYNTWGAERKTLLVREDIRNASAIRELSQLEILSHLIPERIGSPLSLNGLREDVGVAFETIRDWVLLLEQFFYLFRLTPFTGKLARSLKKEAKVYLYDWAEIQDEGHRFENLVALHLLKAARLWKATGEGDIALHYLRNKEKQEVDFALLEKGKPICLVECKLSDENISPHLLHFQKKLSVPIAVQLVHKKGVSKKISENGLTQWIMSADQWLAILP